jgi:hypothetical protein
LRSTSPDRSLTYITTAEPTVRSQLPTSSTESAIRDVPTAKIAVAAMNKKRWLRTATEMHQSIGLNVLFDHLLRLLDQRHIVISCGLIELLRNPEAPLIPAS